jgi:hypothetical protein
MEKEMMVHTTDIAGIRDIAEHFGVKPNVVSNWAARYSDFPAPITEVAAGRLWDLVDVVDWYNDRWAS